MSVSVSNLKATKIKENHSLQIKVYILGFAETHT